MNNKEILNFLIESKYPEGCLSVPKVSEASDMDDFAKSLCEWSWEENKLFELALAMVDEQHPERWEVVAAMVGGEKSAGDVQEHYVILLEDLLVIESGKLDHKLGQVQPAVLVESCFFSIGKDMMYGSKRHHQLSSLAQDFVLDLMGQIASIQVDS
ncbi:SANT/Myb domain [Sesbania bispinosa]|nr:SANT/Myb domain [Sesbania bispinosa]